MKLSTLNNFLGWLGLVLVVKLTQCGRDYDGYTSLLLMRKSTYRKKHRKNP